MEITAQEFRTFFPRFTPVYLPVYKQGKTYFQGDVVYYNRFTPTQSEDIISYSGSILSFTLPLTCVTGYTNDVIVKTDLTNIDVSDATNGEYNVVIPENGNEAYIINNQIIERNEIPQETEIDTIPVMTSANEPYGVVTDTNINNAWKMFRGTYTAQDDCATKSGNSACDVTYTFSEQPQKGNYTISYVQPTMYQGRIEKIVITYTDDSELTIDLRTGGDGTGKKYSFTYDFTATKSIKSFKVLGYHGDSNGVWYGTFRLIFNISEGDIWLNNEDNVIRTYRLVSGTWQPFNDVLCGNLTVLSGAISSVEQPQYDNIQKGDISDFGLFYKCKVEKTSALPTVTTDWEITNQSVLNYCQDSDIINAIAEANINFNEQLFSKEDAKLIFMYLVAYYLTIDFKNALNQSSAGIVTSKSVGSVSESASIPQWILNDKILGAYARNGYGLKYLSLIQPYLVGNVMFFQGATTV